MKEFKLRKMVTAPAPKARHANQNILTQIALAWIWSPTFQ